MIGRYELRDENVEKIYKKDEKRVKKVSFKEKVKIMYLDEDLLEIDFIGCNTSLVNAFRRTILADVNTMAIERVFVHQNTTLVSDENLCLRLGLVPLSLKPQGFDQWTESDEFTPSNSIRYELKHKCTKPDKDKIYERVHSKFLKRIPFESESEVDTVGVLSEDILLDDMVPGQEIDLEAFAVKGNGRDHAKFQAGLSWYRLLTEIKLTEPVEGEDAELLEKVMSPGVIKLSKRKGKVQASVENARLDSCSRNFMRYDNLKNKVQLNKVPDHIVFSVETHSALTPSEILVDSIEILIAKCDDLIDELEPYVIMEDDVER